MSRLYTVNKWNRKKFLDKNLFDKGGPSYKLTPPSSTPYVNWSDSGQAAIALGQTNALVDSAGRGFDLDVSDLNKTTAKTLSSYNKIKSSGTGNSGTKGNAAAVMGAVASAIPETPFKLGKTTYKRGLWDAADPLYQLAGNKESVVGNAFSDAGVSMTKAGLQSGNGWVALAGGITKSLGSLINAGWGLEEDKGLKAGVDAGIDYNNRFMSTAGSYDDLVGPNTVVDNSNVYKGGWFVKGKARRKNANLALDVARGKQRAAASIANNMYNIADDQLLNGLRGYFAYGGPLDAISYGNNMGALGYNLMSDYLNVKKEQAENKGNNTTQIPTYFAEGGKIHINPKNRGKFNATKKRTGKTTEELTHSKNPLTRKRAIFAQNARKWRHDFGGYLNNDNLFAEGGDKNTNKEDLAKENLENLVWYLGQKIKYPNGRKRTSFEKFLNNGLGISEKYTEPWFGETPTQNILFNNPVVTPSYEEQLENVLDTAGKLVRTVGTETKKNTSKGEPYVPHMKFAFGGDLETNGSDFSTGLTHIGTGGSHEENPYEGVQMGIDGEGTPNLVEEDEVVWDDYVFSNRISIDQPTKDKFHIGKKREMTYADLAKKLEKEIAERPNDPISEAGFKAQMETLREEQERQKQEMEAERAKAAFEALPPEEQVAVMNRAAQEEQMAQQAMQEQAMAQQAAEQQGMMQPSPEEAAMAQEQMIPETENAVAPQMQAEGGHLFAVGGVKPYAYSRNWDDFAYFNPKTNSYDEGYLNFVRGINQDWVDRILAGQYGPMNRYLARNRGVKLTPEQVIALGTDKMNSDMHKALAAAYKEYYDKQQKNNKSVDIAPKAGKDFYKALKNQNFRDWWEEYINKPRGLGKYDKLPIEETPLAGKGVDFKRLYKFFTGKDDLEASGDVYTALEALYNTNPGLFLPYDLQKYDYMRALRTPLKGSETMSDEQATTSTDDSGGTIISESELEGMEPESGVEYPTEQDATDAAKAFADKVIKDTLDAYGPESPVSTQEVPSLATPPLTGNSVIDELNSGQGKPIKTVVNGGTPTMPTDDDLRDADKASLYDFMMSPEGQETMRKIKEKQTAENGDTIPAPKDHWLRYAGLFGPAVGLGLMAAGVGKPDYSRLDAALSGLGEYTPADWKPIGNYLTYRPMDIWYEQNRMNANARSTDRAIMNNAAPIGTKMAGLLANAYNNQLASADLYRKGLEYNDAKQAQVENFNRGTDMFNAEAYNKNSMFNAEAANRHNQYRAGLAMRAAQQRLDSDAGWYNSLYGNIGGLFKGLGDLGRDKTEKRWLEWLNKRGVFGNTGTAAYGGEIKKKKKRGFTY